MAALWRKNQNCDPGLSITIQGHEWYKWIDEAIEQKHIQEVV